MLSPLNIVNYFFMSGPEERWLEVTTFWTIPANQLSHKDSLSATAEGEASAMQFMTRISHDIALQLWMLKGTLAKKHWLLHCLGQLPPKTDQQYSPLVTFNINKCHPLKQPHNWKAKGQLNFAKTFPWTNSQALCYAADDIFIITSEVQAAAFPTHHKPSSLRGQPSMKTDIISIN